MKRIFLYLSLAALILYKFNSGYAQETEEVVYGWKNAIIGNLNLTQASFDNWAQGGENTLAWQVKLTADFVLDQEKYNWSNKSKTTLGYAKVGDNEARKSADEIFIETVYTRKIGKLLNPFVSATAKTQYVSGYTYGEDRKVKVSKFMDPGYFTQSVGVGYTPNPDFTTRLGAAVKETITSDFAAPYADDPETSKIEKTKIEPGISSVTEYKKKFQENVFYTSKLDLFTDLEAFDRIDLLWENNIIFKISKLFNVSFDLDLLYDKDISNKRQLKQVLAIGLSYTFL